MEEIRSELHPTNGPPILRERPELSKRPEKGEATKERARRREWEQQRRAALRVVREEIASFFLVPWQHRISVGELLLFGESANLKS